ncbi:MAG: GTPase HflX, partial [Rhodococcus sp. (in: high G+C Gram-positive bacteria)]
LLLHVVDGSDPLPTDQIKAVREVIADVVKERDSAMPPELIVVNKIDAADPVQLTQLRGLLPGARFVSARTGEGIDELRDHLGEILAWPESEVDVLVPYTRGDLVARIHTEGKISKSSHEADGTRVEARVPTALASVLTDFAYEIATA